MISHESVVAAIRTLVAGDLADGDVVILNLGDGVYYGLNQVGGRIWHLIQEPRRVSEVRAVLLGEYEVDAERCERELFALLEDLAAHGLIEVRNGSAT